MPGEKSLPMVEIMNDKADNCQVLQIFGDAKSLESALVKKDENEVKEIKISVDESTSFESKEFLSKDQKTITNEVIERDLE
ncbi:11196_t:CDS:2 [Funneliformis geosporum]|uniref:7203_t:CDS:1 n=1 Tax=Funneliformis geosporum TaxID=1117311 RepID=A0A9W4SQT8_9GLOM|nr:7203_t:CDS:2 [Funneliformis geosporum]CAI2181557.1 11196_t:CDS:2 [Funneliformis geosporum]